MAIANYKEPTTLQKNCKHKFDIFIRCVDEDYDDNMYKCSKCGWNRIFEGADS